MAVAIELEPDEVAALEIIRSIAFGELEILKQRGRIVTVTKLRETFKIV